MQSYHCVESGGLYTWFIVVIGEFIQQLKSIAITSLSNFLLSRLAHPRSLTHDIGEIELKPGTLPEQVRLSQVFPHDV